MDQDVKHQSPSTSEPKSQRQSRGFEAISADLAALSKTIDRHLNPQAGLKPRPYPVRPCKAT